MNKQNFDDQYMQAAMNAAATRTYRLAARFGLATPDREDIEQELILDMMERAQQYDPGKGSPGTFTGVVSEHRAVEVLDGLMKYRARMCFFSGGHAANDSEIDDSSDEQDENVVPMWSDDRDLFADGLALRDLEKAIAYMNNDQAALFELLETYQDLPSACKACGISTAAFYRRVNDLQMHLRMFGFKSAA